MVPAHAGVIPDSVTYFDYVVPAHAGVIPDITLSAVLRLGGPRTCGGDPIILLKYCCHCLWSPHMRG